MLLGVQRRPWRGGGFGAALQHRGRGLCDDRLALFGSGSFLLPSMACILVLLLALRKPIEKAEDTEAEKSSEEVGA